ncbi:MAG: hypothetical protein DWQ34_19425 [Planctomycetota bacterium]|nr:MAG: hypothetical protein DWQ34_19425 [Planctomycetota bacterium]REK28999.1 MAG: hypothetical protein DWQ41_05495 [Planctomycetota bacterium]REK39569.1 MAG: hypothetical protein DWQ45_01450 [Planctomycetota bacterium]
MVRTATVFFSARLTICLVLTGDCEAQQPRLGRGAQWVRSHSFWISGLTQNGELYEVDEYRGAGLNTLMAWDPRPLLFQKSADGGLPIHYHVHQNHGETPQDFIEHVRGLVSESGWITGLLMHDEPRVPAMDRVGAVCDALREAFPDLLVYSNALPKGATNPAKYGFTEDVPDDFYAAYVEEFARRVRGDVLMVDIYPLGTGGGHSRVYFETLALFRHWGLRQDVPYWLFIQSTDLGGRGRRPSESDLRFQIFAPLTFGFTGICYFTYDPALGSGLIDGNRNRTPLYELAADVNDEVMHIGRSLRFLRSTRIAFILGRHEADGRLVENEMPPLPDTEPWTLDEVSDRREMSLIGVDIEKDGAGRDALVGFFRDDDGGEYFMVTNLFHEKHMSAADATQVVTLHFSPDVAAVTRLSRETGKPEELAIRDGRLELRLPGGTGDLFRFGDAKFPGLESDGL